MLYYICLFGIKRFRDAKCAYVSYHAVFIYVYEFRFVLNAITRFLALSLGKKLWRWKCEWKLYINGTPQIVNAVEICIFTYKIIVWRQTHAVISLQFLDWDENVNLFTLTFKYWHSPNHRMPRFWFEHQRYGAFTIDRDLNTPPMNPAIWKRSGSANVLGYWRNHRITYANWQAG